MHENVVFQFYILDGFPIFSFTNVSFLLPMFTLRGAIFEGKLAFLRNAFVQQKIIFLVHISQQPHIGLRCCKKQNKDKNVIFFVLEKI